MEKNSCKNVLYRVSHFNCLRLISQKKWKIQETLYIKINRISRRTDDESMDFRQTIIAISS